MNPIYRASNAVIALTLVAGIAACGTQGMPVAGNVATVDVSGLERDDSESPTIIYRRPGAPGLGEFDAFIIDPVRIVYDDTRMKELTPGQAARMQQYLHAAMVRELRAGGYQVGTRSAPGKLRVSFTLSGLKAPSAAPNVATAVFPYALSVGEVTVEAVLRDGLTDRLEGVVLSRASGSRWLNASPWSTWSDVESFLDSWAKGFREAVDEAHGR